MDGVWKTTDLVMKKMTVAATVKVSTAIFVQYEWGIDSF